MTGRLIVISGAGLSAESGIPTFRDSKDGLWFKYKPEVMADISTYSQNRELVHEFYNLRRSELPQYEPNAAHYGLAGLQATYGTDRVIIFTQNVDDLLERAGVSAVHHVHGELSKMKCQHCSHIFDIGNRNWDCNTEACPSCGMAGSCKPGVIFFGEHAPGYDKLWTVCNSATADDIVAVIGTSGEVLPIPRLVNLHPQRGQGVATSVLMNKDMCLGIDHQSFDYSFLKPATESIGWLVEFVNKRFTTAGD